MPRRRDEPVRLTRIYTRTGDAGETSLGDGTRVTKLDPRIVAFGAVDELNSLIGLALAADVDAEVRAVLERVQNELFDLGADLSVPLGGGERLRVDAAAIERLELDCDRFNAGLEPLRSFVLPGGDGGRRAAAGRTRRVQARRAGRPRGGAAG